MTEAAVPKKQNWHEVKTEVLKNWNKLTSEEVEKSKGDMKAIGTMIQTRYGESQKGYIDKLSVIFKNYDGSKDFAAGSDSKSVKP